MVLFPIQRVGTLVYTNTTLHGCTDIYLELAVKRYYPALDTITHHYDMVVNQ